MSDDTDDNVIQLPPRDGESGAVPQAPDIGGFFFSEPPRSDEEGIPPESPLETTMELPPVPSAPDPGMALRSEGAPPLERGEEDGEYEEGEYVQPRSLADRLGDWLEFRLEKARALHESEAPFREAEIARKTAMLEARTAQDVALMEQNAKLHAAQMKAKADKAAARGKADAARTSSSGMGADKGGRSKASGGGGSSRGGGSSGGSGRGAGTNGSGGGPGRGSGGGSSPKGGGKGSGGSAGGRGGGSKGNESSGSSRGRQNGSGGSGAGKFGSGKGAGSGKGGGSGNSGSGKGGSKGDGGKTSNSSAVGPAAERACGRQERAAARQAARQQRRSAAQAADLADRSKDRDQARANREERRRVKAERRAAKQAKRDAAKADADRTTFGAAVAEEAQRRWDKRRTDAEAEDGDGKNGDAKDGDAATEKTPKDGPDAASDGRKDTPADEPGGTGKAAPGPSGGPGKDKPSGGPKTKAKRSRSGASKGGGKARTGRNGSRSPFGAEDAAPTYDWPGRPDEPPRHRPEAAEEDIEDAVIVDDPADPFGAHVLHPAGLPPAPEPHTPRPGTTRPTPQEHQEDSVGSTQVTTTSGQVGLAAKHRTDITFDEYLVAMANIAIAADLDKDRAENLAQALGRVADALRDMADDLIGDHNIDIRVTDLICDLADAAARMKTQAARCAEECGTAFEAARLAAAEVARVYGEDIRAMDDAGLRQASAAAHHD